MKFLVGFVVLLVMGISGLTAGRYPRFRQLVSTFAPGERIAVISIRYAALVLILLSLGCLLVALLAFAGVLD